MIYTAYNDPAHGWLKVPKAELEALGIADKISRYSYERGEFAYLEEDCDLSIFIDAKGGREAVRIKDTYTNKSSRVRSYDSYYHMSVEERREADKIIIALMNYQQWNKKAIRQIDNANLDTLRFWKDHFGLNIS